MTLQIPFGRVLRRKMKGNDVHGMRRALARYGYGELGKLNIDFTAEAELNVRRFQQVMGLRVDGVYGPMTHAKLVPSYDDYAFLLYTGKPPRPPVAALQLPASFQSTHGTSGLAGYPAIDVFAKADTVVLAAAPGLVRRFSGSDPTLPENIARYEPGGPYAWSMYIDEGHGVDRYLTHLATRFVKVGQKIQRGDRIATVQDARVAKMSTTLSHVHMGLHRP